MSTAPEMKSLSKEEAQICAYIILQMFHQCAYVCVFAPFLIHTSLLRRPPIACVGRGGAAAHARILYFSCRTTGLGSRNMQKSCAHRHRWAVVVSRLSHPIDLTGQLCLLRSCRLSYGCGRCCSGAGVRSVWTLSDFCSVYLSLVNSAFAFNNIINN